MFYRDALNKMKDVYEKNPQMGDPGSLQPKISETMLNMEKLRSEIHKNEVMSPVMSLLLMLIKGNAAPKGTSGEMVIHVVALGFTDP